MIYSVGSFDDFSFEEAIMQDVSSACEIHVFDHTVSNHETNRAAGSISNVDEADAAPDTTRQFQSTGKEQSD